MKTILIALCFILFSLSAVAGPSIINGTPVASDDPIAKSIVGIHLQRADGKYFICTGILITRNVALTAAHCLIDEETRTWLNDYKKKVVFDRNVLNPNAISRPIRYEWAAGFLNGKENDDIAMVFFDGDLPAGYEVAEIADNDTEPSMDSTVFIAGYGISTNINDTSSAGILRKGTGTYAGKFNNGENFQLNKREGTTVCKGDSGGPALLKMGEKYFLFGIVYQADLNCKSFGTYSSVQGKRNWIYDSLISIYKAMNRAGEFKSFDSLGTIYKIGKGNPPTSLDRTFWSGRCFSRSNPSKEMAAGFYFGDTVQYYWAPEHDPSFYDGSFYSDIEPLLTTTPGHISYRDSLYSVESLSLYQGKWSRMRFFDGGVVVQISSPMDGQVMTRCLYSRFGI